MSAVLVLATQNAKKRRELEDLVAGGPWLVRTLDDVGLGGLAIEETGATFAENARIKADAVLAALPEGERRETFAVVADDSGIIVDALSPPARRDAPELPGAPAGSRHDGPDAKPGVRSARFAADHGVEMLGPTVDDANNALLLLLLEAVPDEMRGARFASAVCAVVVQTGEHLEAFGTVEGRIARDLEGDGGFGYDPLFLPDEAPGRRMAELTPDGKHAISHRGRAMRALLAQLTGRAEASRGPAAEAFVFKRARPR